MNVRDKIKDLIREYENSLNFADGNATIEQQEEVLNVLSGLNFYSTRLMLFCNESVSKGLDQYHIECAEVKEADLIFDELYEKYGKD